MTVSLSFVPWHCLQLASAQDRSFAISYAIWNQKIRRMCFSSDHQEWLELVGEADPSIVAEVEPRALAVEIPVEVRVSCQTVLQEDVRTLDRVAFRRLVVVCQSRMSAHLAWYSRTRAWPDFAIVLHWGVMNPSLRSGRDFAQPWAQRSVSAICTPERTDREF